MPVDKSKPQKTNGRSVPGASGIARARELEAKLAAQNVGGSSSACLTRWQQTLVGRVYGGDILRCVPTVHSQQGSVHVFVIAATDHLHRRIARTGDRIRMLEDALTALHASKGDVDGAVHPLLVDGEDVSLGADDATPLQTSSAHRTSESWEVLEVVPDGATPNENPEIDAFGTLSISDHGISTFFGPTGGSPSHLESTSHREYPECFNLRFAILPLPPTLRLFTIPVATLHTCFCPRFSRPPCSSGRQFPSRQLQVHLWPLESQVSLRPTRLSLLFLSAFPLTTIGPPTDYPCPRHARICPPRAHARTLVQSYFSHVAWLFRGVTRGQHNSASPDGDTSDDLDEELGDGEDENHTGPHDLALLFMVFAAGALVQPPTSPGTEDEAHRQHVAAEAEHLHQIARMALALQPVLEKRSVVTIQLLHLMSIYTSLASPAGHVQHGKGGEEDAEMSMEMTWSLATLAAHLSQTIGLHRDSARWGISTIMVQRRRILFWDLFVADVWTSLSTGRPPSFSLAYIDCSFPKYENEKAKDRACAFLSLSLSSGVRRGRDGTHLDCGGAELCDDHGARPQVREFPLPLPDDTAPDDVGASLQRCVLEHVRETVLLYNHRSFFAQAIIEQPVNPLKSMYAPSFLAAYRASATILKSVREQFANMPNVCGRFWMMWTFAFSAAVVFGTVVTRGPRSPLAAAAMAELEQACALFSKAAVYSRRTTRALNDPSGGNNSGLQLTMTGVLRPGGLPVKVKEEPDDELSIFAGHTCPVSEEIQLMFSAQQPPRQHHQQQQQRLHGYLSEEIPYGSYEESPHRQYPAQYPAQQPLLPRQRQHSMPSSPNSHAMHEMGRLTPTVKVNLNMTWDMWQNPQSEHDYLLPLSVMDECMQHSHQSHTPDGSRMPHSIPPSPSAPYAWPVDLYAVEAEPQPQHSHYQQQQYVHNQGMYAHSPQAVAAYQAHNAELVQLGLAMRGLAPRREVEHIYGRQWAV
ncbi:fungal-specific transcription factor domain-containing protein [Mycena olivaceomarginata]|nr:fungal-specific transcription factor domain-containing protein [Mycena olivaceomarginata]